MLHDVRASRSVLGDALANSTYDVIDVAVTRTLVDRVSAIRPDAIVVDLDDARFDVVRLCAALRDAIAVRVLIVSSSVVDDESVVAALDAGADDVIVGSSPEVIDAHVRVALRAQPSAPALPAMLEVGDVVVDLRAHAVFVGGTAVRCPPVQYELLVTLANRPGTTLGADELLRAVWGARPGDVHPRRLRIAISVLRGILGIGPRRPRVVTVPRVGYRLVVPG